MKGTPIYCKKCGCTEFTRTNKPTPVSQDGETEFREFKCTGCGELIYHEVPIEYVPVFDENDGLTYLGYQKKYDDDLYEPDDLYEVDLEQEAFDYDLDHDYDDDGGFDPGIG